MLLLLQMTIMKIQFLLFNYKQEFSNAIECALEMVGMEFLNVTIATDDHKEDSFSVLQ